MRIKKNKQNSSEKKKIILLTIMIISTILISLITINSEIEEVQAEPCCLGNNGCIDYNLVGGDETAFRDVCVEQGGEVSENACAIEPQCEIGCCCGLGTSSSPVSQYQCGGTFIPGQPGIGQSCNQICNQGILTLQGIVYNQDGTIIAGATIKINGQTESITNQDGEYITEVQENTEYEILVTHPNNPSCSTIETVIIGTQNYEQDLTLPQCDQNPQCVEEWIFNWENEAQQCGRRLNIEKIKDCGYGQATKPATAGIPCIDPNQYECILNGVQDPGEECEPPNLIFNGQPTTCQEINPQYTGGTLTCSSSCLINTDNCYTCPTTPTECTADQCNECAICQTSDVCQLDCRDKTITMEIATTNSPLGYNIDWNEDILLQCGTDIVNYALHRCKSDDGTSCNPFGQITRTLPRDTTNFYDTDAGFENSETYCYQLTANLIDVEGDYKIQSQQQCVTLQSPQCIGKENGVEFCYTNENGESGIATCQNGILQDNINYCPSQSACFELQEGVFCQETTICEKCNGLFGIFGFSEIPLSIFPPYITIAGNLIDVCSLNNNEFKNICYYEEQSTQQTNVGELNICSEVTNCYDYKSKNSCIQDSCTIDQTCQWRSLTTEETGIGVCVPTNTEQQDCSRCNENSLFGEYCPKELCELYTTDESCYYNEEKRNFVIIDSVSCMNQEDVGCETYETQQQCEDGSNINVDINYQQILNQYEVIGGTNKILSESADVLGKGRCVWIENTNEQTGQCVKDADNNRKVEQTIFNIRDCLVNDEQCLTDFEAPETIVYLEDNREYSETEIRQMAYTVEDNTYNGEDIETYFTMIKEETEIPGAYNRKYPDETAQLITINGQGNYLLRYYSKDKAQNYEEIKEKQLRIIPDLSGIQLTWNTDSEYIPNIDRYISNLEINVLYEDELTCKIELKQIDEPTNNFNGDDTKTGTQIQFIYTQLEDANYVADIVCTDSHLQIYEEQLDIYIEADTTIKNPQPRGINTIYAGEPVIISIETTQDATCYYSSDEPTNTDDAQPQGTPNPNSQTWIKYTQTDGTQHNAELTHTQTGMKFYYSKCEFNDGTNYIGNNGDIIYFPIDLTGPTYTITTPQLQGISGITNNQEYIIQCKDESIDYAGQKIGYGCKTNYQYCTYLDFNDCNPTANTEFNKKIEIQPPSGTQITFVKIQSEDYGENIGTQKIPLNIRDYEFIPPNIEICNPDDDECLTDTGIQISTNEET